MESNRTSEANSKEEQTIKTTWLDIISIVLLINLVLVILVSIFAIIVNSEYLNELIFLGIITVVVFIVVIIIIFTLSLGLPMFARRLFHWEEEKETDWIVNLLIIFGSIFIIGTAIGLYLVALPFFPQVQDPFNLQAINPSLGIIYSIWWFFGFIISALIITIIYLLLESG
ncbi:MAG: hypothetical protein JSV04_08390 [Candidatus Heimdallarchaeota archaeon]|nr:MAG: hypothetical protein JSV04_08390 [Candidatus Heimdallarchaeota archaeon]